MHTQCVLLDFDRHVLTAVAPGNATAAMTFFLQHLLLAEGSPVRCPTQGQQVSGESRLLHEGNQPHVLSLCPLHHVEWVKEQLLRLGLLLRRTGPQQVLQQLEHRFHMWHAMQGVVHAH